MTTKKVSPINYGDLLRKVYDSIELFDNRQDTITNVITEVLGNSAVNHETIAVFDDKVKVTLPVKYIPSGVRGGEGAASAYYNLLRVGFDGIAKRDARVEFYTLSAYIASWLVQGKFLSDVFAIRAYLLVKGGLHIPESLIIREVKGGGRQDAQDKEVGGLSIRHLATAGLARAVELLGKDKTTINRGQRILAEGVSPTIEIGACNEVIAILFLLLIAAIVLIGLPLLGINIFVDTATGRDLKEAFDLLMQTLK